MKFWLNRKGCGLVFWYSSRSKDDKRKKFTIGIGRKRPLLRNQASYPLEFKMPGFITPLCMWWQRSVFRDYSRNSASSEMYLKEFRRMYRPSNERTEWPEKFERIDGKTVITHRVPIVAKSIQGGVGSRISIQEVKKKYPHLLF